MKLLLVSLLMLSSCSKIKGFMPQDIDNDVKMAECQSYETKMHSPWIICKLGNYECVVRLSSDEFTCFQDFSPF